MDFSRIKTLFNEIKTAQYPYQSDWQELIYYCSGSKSFENRSNGNGTSPQSERGKKYKFDPTAQTSCEDSALFLYNMCIGDVDKSFMIGDDKLGDIKEANKIFKRHLKSDASCFRESMESYFDECQLLGNAGIGNFIDSKKIVPYIDCFSMDTCAYQRMNRTKIYSVIDERKYPIYELVEDFGLENLPADIQKKYQERPSELETLKTIWIPNQWYKEGNLGSRGLPYSRVRFLESSETPLEDIAVANMPDFAAIKRANREIYGRAPGAKIINIIIALNRIIQKTEYGLEQMTDPTTLLLINNAFSDLRTLKIPGAMIPTKIKNAVGSGSITQALQDTKDPTALFQVLATYFRDIIVKAYRLDIYLDVFNRGNMTLGEFQGRMDIRNKILISEINPHKPVVDRIIKRMFRDCYLCGMFKGVIEVENINDLSEDNLEIKWNNAMALVEKSEELQNIADFETYIAPIVQRNPGIAAAIDDYAELKKIAEATNMQDNIASEEDYTNFMQQQQQAAAAQQQADIISKLPQPNQGQPQ